MRICCVLAIFNKNPSFIIVYLENTECVQETGNGGVVPTIHPHRPIGFQRVIDFLRESNEHVFEQKAGFEASQ